MREYAYVCVCVYALKFNKNHWKPALAGCFTIIHSCFSRITFFSHPLRLDLFFLRVRGLFRWSNVQCGGRKIFKTWACFFLKISYLQIVNGIIYRLLARKWHTNKQFLFLCVALVGVWITLCIWLNTDPLEQKRRYRWSNRPNTCRMPHSINVDPQFSLNAT